MEFGIFTMFTVREGGSQFDAFQEWFRLVQQAEEQGIDTFWIGESHFRPERAVMASPLIGASAVAAPVLSGSRWGWRCRCCPWPTLCG